MSTSNNNNPKVGATLDDERLAKTLTFEDHYTLTKRLASGSYGIVYATKHNATQQDFAVKVIDRTKLKVKDDAAVFREVSVMKDLRDAPGVVALMDFFVKPKAFHVVQQYAQGGDLFDRLSKRKTYTEKDARDVAFRLLQTVAHMHERKIVHRDLKTENLLLQDERNDTYILVADFGFAKRVPPEGLKTRCGTPSFVAPELVVGVNYGVTVDMWAVGVILYLLLGGYPPFRDDNHRGLFRKIRAADYVFHEIYWDNVSVEAKQLIASLLTVDPEYRVTAEKALTSSWLTMDDVSLSSRDLSKSLAEIKKFNAKRRLKSAMKAVAYATTATFWNPDFVTFSDQLREWDQTDASLVNITPADSESTVDGGSPPLPPPPPPPSSSDGGGTESTVTRISVKLPFRETYELKSQIRKGSFATVWQCVHRMTGDEFAVKIIKRDGLKPSEDEAVLNEVALVQSLEYKHIVQMVDFFEEPEYFFLVMEYMKGGDVFDRMIEKSRYTEKDARDLIRTLLKAVRFMHKHGVAHRDLKPQNLFLQSKDDDANIKVGDFGFARRVHTPQSLTTRCGTPTYVSPEILKNVPHDQSTDMWSVGVICHVLLVGYPPFMEDNQHDLFRKIRTGDYEFFKEDWKHVSEQAKNLIRGLLVVDSMKRLTADEALRSEWIREKDDFLFSHDLTESLQVLKMQKARLRTLARTILWFGRDKAEPIEVEIPIDENERSVSEMHDLFQNM